jgi:peroxiredoxin
VNGWADFLEIFMDDMPFVANKNFAFQFHVSGNISVTSVESGEVGQRGRHYSMIVCSCVVASLIEPNLT